MQIRPASGLLTASPASSPALVSPRAWCPCRPATIPTAILLPAPRPPTSPSVWSERNHETHPSGAAFGSPQHFPLSLARRAGAGSRLGQYLPRCSAHPPTVAAFPPGLRLPTAPLRPVVVATAAPAPVGDHRVHPAGLCASPTGPTAPTYAANRESSLGGGALLIPLPLWTGDSSRPVSF